MILIFFLLCSIGIAQTTDSVVVAKDSVVKKLPKEKGPRNAAILSAVIPGAGQIYNRKYWKAPIVWGALGALGYYFLNNQKMYSLYRDSLVKEVAANPTSSSIDYYQKQKIIFRKHRDLLSFGLIAFYAIQIIDANVDAHLKTFDVSDDLSLRIDTRPVIVGNAWGPGLSLKLNFK
jgi:hypothetical protein